MTPNELDRLILDISDGQPEVLEELYLETKAAVFGLAFSILRDYSLAEDVTQDVFVKINIYADKYKACGKGMAWILRITRNLSLNYLKKLKNTVPLEESFTIHKDIPKNNLEEEIILKEAIKTLNEKQREIVVLYAVSGLSHKEIAGILNIAYPTVRWHYHMAIKKLKNILEGEG